MADFIYTTKGTKSFKDLRISTKENLKSIAKKDIQNKQTGIIARMTREEVKKSISKKAVDKSIEHGYTKEEHFEVLNDIENLFIESKFDYKEPDNKGRDMEVYRFLTDTIVNGKMAQAKITVFVKNEGNNKIYTLELRNLTKPTSS